MHLIKDENGNLVQHGHEHTPEHSHAHTHADGVTHTHSHSHEAEGGHAHSHGDGCGDGHDHCGSCEGGDCKKETIALLTYMLQHNEHHAAELDLMHNKENTEYNNFLVDMLSETQECVNIARKAGIKDENIILDPGVGFGKTYEMNLETMNHLELFQHLGFPVLLGTSRKSMIGLTLDLPVDQRVEGTLATSVIGVMKGCAFVRVHDVKENRRVIQMTEAILGRNR